MAAPSPAKVYCKGSASLIPKHVSVDRISGIDSLRWICALWVVLFHENTPKLDWFVDRSHGVARVFGGLYDVLFCGPAAVIVFFVISGFCIHFPFADGRAVKAKTFLLSRLIRIGIPALVVVGISMLQPNGARFMWRLLFWSLYCELVYYSLYPLLNRLSFRIGWNALVVGSFVVFIAFLIGTNGMSDLMYARMDLWDPVLGFPCWLLGCKVAELVHHKQQLPIAQSPVGWRLGAWLLSILSFGSMLHFGISFKLSLTAFAFYVAVWLWAEILASSKERWPRWLEFAGATSYSLYLTHPLATQLYQSMIGYAGGVRFVFIAWVGQLLFVLLASFAFWAFVENPVHRFARQLRR